MFGCLGECHDVVSLCADFVDECLTDCDEFVDLAQDGVDLTCGELFVGGVGGVEIDGIEGVGGTAQNGDSRAFVSVDGFAVACIKINFE